jgi:hypothetical protein
VTEEYERRFEVPCLVCAGASEEGGCFFCDFLRFLLFSVPLSAAGEEEEGGGAEDGSAGFLRGRLVCSSTTPLRA